MTLSLVTVVATVALVWMVHRHDLYSVIGLTTLNVAGTTLLIAFIRSINYRADIDFHPIVMEFFLYGMATVSAWLAWVAVRGRRNINEQTT